MEGERTRSTYPSDLTDAEWDAVRALLPPTVPAGRPRTTNLREVVNAIRYVIATRCSWRSLPMGFPPDGTVRDYYHKWQRSGLWERIQNTVVMLGAPHEKSA